MSSPTPAAVRSALEGAGLRVVASSGWDDPGRAASGTWSPAYVLMHHTANGGAKGNAPSLAYCERGTYPPVRNCHLLIARDGTVHLVYALKCYHAGEGGPGRWGDGPSVPADAMNGYAYGIEIESAGTSLDVDANGGTNGYTDAQVVAAAAAAGALLALLGRSTGCAINHRTWAPGRKTDTLRDDAWWHDRIEEGDEDMALTDADAAKVARAVWGYENTAHDPRDAYGLIHDTADAVGAGSSGGPTSITPADLEAIAQRTADLLAERLRA